jgi:acyl carrier protein
MMRLEEEFGIEFSNDEMLGFSTVADVVAEIERKTK